MAVIILGFAATASAAVSADESFILAQVAGTEDILIADFEGDDYGDWQVRGTAFGFKPASGTLPGQMKVAGYTGRGLVNSYCGGDAGTGTLTSPDFAIRRPFINFLIGGVGYAGQTCMNLLVNGRIVRTAAGPNARPGGSERLDWHTWDVSDLIGKTARLQIVDDSTGGWGHITVDHICQSQTRRQLGEKTCSFAIQKRYLNFPVKNGNPKRTIQLSCQGKVIRDFEIELASQEPDFWVFADVSEFNGQTLSLTIDRYDPACTTGFDAVFQDDAFPGQEMLYHEPLRPQFHFSSRRGWLNDTNGLVYYDGEYHLFYQHNPYGWQWGNMSWGHAVSPDMIHWKELPAALHQDALGMIYSGSAVVDEYNTAGFQTGREKPLVAVYTSAGGENPLSKGQPYTQSIAYSNDRGRTWTKYPHNPVIGPIADSTRDPKVIWHEPSGQWVMLLWIEDKTLSVFTSGDLKTWQRQGNIDGFFECPEFFELPVDDDPNNRKWVVYGASGDYQIGRFNGTQFASESGIIKYEYGNCFYASQTFNHIPASDGRRIQMGWGRIAMPGMPFNQMILFPVSLTLRTTDEGIRLFVNPVEEIASLHQQHWMWKQLTVKPNDNPLSRITGELFHIQAVLTPDGADACRFVIRGVPVIYEAASERLTCQGQSAPLKRVDGQIRLEILVDRMSIEIFANGGRVYMPVGVNLAGGPQTIAFSVEQGSTRIETLDIYTLKSIWF
ncbi:MAG TPA: glycoside hydrolase family 32 protein [Anaerohalosphaeraceae bacterium]|nr:glycoside hydrolase family 32 protein [Anaerohalosphaeraceae bacterium]